jgi:hypothetical protein
VGSFLFCHPAFMASRRSGFACCGHVERFGVKAMRKIPGRSFQKAAFRIVSLFYKTEGVHSARAPAC